MLIYYYKKSYQKMFDFEGRASRSEYWYNVLADSFLIPILYSLTFSTLVENAVLSLKKNAPLSEQPLLFTILSVTFSLWSISRIIPFISLFIRRLHDTGKSGWNVLWLIIPLIGWLILFIFTLQASQEGRNRYGENPRKRKKKKYYRRKFYRSGHKK